MGAILLIQIGQCLSYGFWKEEDVWEYIRKYDLQYSDIYNKGYDRTGCVFCMFGVHLEKVRIDFKE